ncbi:hypothetical protein [Streptomyces flaveolus]|uniref:hypothetical protein n=1 Tax=Streptomyces TaxID=1883 RepID=UPI0019BB06AF|nr:hypothetical protein [Streptomyces flaveolus]GGQ78359.1 hypothetical protein GCM10010216_45200 [Streptomyces flaveolus]
MATAVRLLDLGFFRIGNDRYTELNNSYGLTTLLREHSRCQAGAVLFTYTGKHGKEIVQTVADPAACRSSPHFCDAGAVVIGSWPTGSSAPGTP